MPTDSSAHVVVVARRLLALPPSPEGTAWRVLRLDGKGAYFLVHVDGKVACIDAVGNALLSSADATRTPISVSRQTALALAALGDAASVELVWKPCAATRSMFDPLWSVALDGRVVFVDQRGKVWPTLAPSGPGGGAG